MQPKLKIRKSRDRSYGNSEEYSNLTELQEKVIVFFDKYKKGVNQDSAVLREFTQEECLRRYILLRSLYAFAKKFSEVLSILKENDEDVYEQLYDIVRDKIVEEDLPKLYGNADVALHLLREITCQFTPRIDFIVFSNAAGHWSFHDIMGTIARCGLQSNALLQAVREDKYPEKQE